MPDNRILLGVVGRPFGVRGHVHVTSHTADPADLAAYGPLSDARGRRFTLRWCGEGVAEIAEIIGGKPVKITDRTTAERLTNLRLFVDRSQLPPPDAEEFYLADLIGLTAVDAAGRAVGTVTTVHDYGAGTSLEITGASPMIVPFTQACVPEVDLALRQIIVVPPAEITVEERQSA